MKVRCPDCNVRFDLDESEYDEGDFLSCPDCNLELTIITDSSGKMKVREAKEKDLDEADEFDEYYEE